MQNSRRFRWRAFTSLYITLSFLVLASSGAVLFMAPPGRVANWSRWTLGALDKAGWQAVHTVFALLFLVAGSFHLFFNWRVLLSYLRARLAEGARVKRELLAAGGLATAVLALTISGAPPFATVMALGESAKNGWVPPEAEPPLPHAELMTLEKLAAATALPLEAVLRNLEASGIDGAAPGITLAAIASRAGLTPQQVYVKLRGSNAPAGQTTGGGYGRRTVGEICRQLGVPVEEGLRRLRRAGIEANEGDTMRALAERAGKNPHDLAQLLSGA
jgi:hypothetical protein